LRALGARAENILLKSYAASHLALAFNLLMDCSKSNITYPVAAQPTDYESAALPFCSKSNITYPVAADYVFTGDFDSKMNCFFL